MLLTVQLLHLKHGPCAFPLGCLSTGTAWGLWGGKHRQIYSRKQQSPRWGHYQQVCSFQVPAKGASMVVQRLLVLCDQPLRGLLNQWDPLLPDLEATHFLFHLSVKIFSGHQIQTTGNNSFSLPENPLPPHLASKFKNSTYPALNPRWKLTLERH